MIQVQSGPCLSAVGGRDAQFATGERATDSSCIARAFLETSIAKTSVVFCIIPIVFPWMPAASVFFDDPDGNVLEYIAMLPDPPRPEPGPVSWSEWQAIHKT